MLTEPTFKLLAPPLMTPLKVAVCEVAAARVLVPAPKVMALPRVLVAVPNNVPPLIVTAPDDKLLPDAPPEATDNIPPVMVVPPV